MADDVKPRRRAEIRDACLLFRPHEWLTCLGLAYIHEELGKVDGAELPGQTAAAFYGARFLHSEGIEFHGFTFDEDGTIEVRALEKAPGVHMTTLAGVDPASLYMTARKVLSQRAPHLHEEITALREQEQLWERKLEESGIERIYKEEVDGWLN